MNKVILDGTQFEFTLKQWEELRKFFASPAIAGWPQPYAPLPAWPEPPYTFPQFTDDKPWLTGPTWGGVDAGHISSIKGTIDATDRQ